VQDPWRNPWPLPSTPSRTRNAAVDSHVTLNLVPSQRAPRLARAFAADALESWAAPVEKVDAVQLVVSELVTNAVVHAPESPSITLELFRTQEAVRVLVSDASPQEPERREGPAPWSAGSGRGVALVDSIADRWGTERRSPRGKTVWCELRAEPTTP
jgi:anti-sigma regulatory factor (Ser/Thr protein kinase)